MSIELVKELREETGVPPMQCKKAVEEAGGDKEKAREILKKHGASFAAKKASRDLGAGVIAAYIHFDKRIGVLVEVLCESDFVARNADFRALADDIAMHIAAMNPSAVNGNGENQPDALLQQPFVRESEITIRELIERATQKLGEKIEVSRFVRYALLEVS